MHVKYSSLPPFVRARSLFLSLFFLYLFTKTLGLNCFFDAKRVKIRRAGELESDHRSCRNRLPLLHRFRRRSLLLLRSRRRRRLRARRLRHRFLGKKRARISTSPIQTSGIPCCVRFFSLQKSFWGVVCVVGGSVRLSRALHRRFLWWSFSCAHARDR